MGNGIGAWHAIEATRRNHALEHAAVAVLLERGGFRRSIVGRSTPSGFYIYGRLSRPELESAVAEALRRLQRGEEEWAVSPFCGTNLAVAGTLAALSVLAVVGNRSRVAQLPNAIVAAVASLLAAQPLGRLAQKYVTTSPHLQGVRVTGITEYALGPLRYYRIDTEQAAA
ncbi:MAG: hypothetical protein HY689_01045 [Chloroflexi bacterium]|nr:hypothetical protein [Chloroflexota bacterium]